MKPIHNPWEGLDGYMCFGCAPENKSGLHLEFYEDGADIVAQWKPEACFQGWLNTLHGGILCTLMDEVAGWVVTRKLHTAGLTSQLNTRFLHPVSVTEPCITIRARLREMKRNIAYIDSEVYNYAGEVCTRAEAVYFTFSKEKAAEEFHFRSCAIENE